MEGLAPAAVKGLKPSDLSCERAGMDTGAVAATRHDLLRARQTILPIGQVLDLVGPIHRLLHVPGSVPPRTAQ
jgi:hypothetical protein